MTDHPAAPPFDPQEMLRNLGGDRDIACLLLDQLLLDLPERQIALAAALAAGDQDTARREAHTIKGQAASGAAARLRERARAVEHECRDGRLAEAAAALPGLDAELAAAAVAWRDYLERGA
jgi:HPt (histidine-containing phosphotransfer) domain-containing protein